MKLILCQPAIKRFEWELEVCLTNLRSVGFDLRDVVLLFTKHDESIPQRLADEYGVEVHVYNELRNDKSYIPSVKPWLWWQYLAEDKSRQDEDYFYFDSDVIFRKRPDFRKLKPRPDRWLCSDTNGYLNVDYIKQCKNGEKVLTRMADIVGVTTASLETINRNSGGAQWIISHPTAEYWRKVYNDSNRLWRYFQTVDSNIQKWTAEMWSQLWNMMYFNIGPVISDELDFCWATDPIERWSETKTMHNAGVTGEMHDLFFKGKYTGRSPFDDDLSFVDNSKCSYKYAQAVKAVK
ncbi:hypothetical protein [Lacticaseibacillus paracasei]|uniref:hypothetical protein n=1 Tax=Lacticaseibacillus paracasei TaxID=1597 RepID=UPI00189AE873|nr:hypothetical protein [Lacticaseibacillus paracasei]